jgi:hypothetical protein
MVQTDINENVTTGILQARDKHILIKHVTQKIMSLEVLRGSEDVHGGLLQP